MPDESWEFQNERRLNQSLIAQNEVMMRALQDIRMMSRGAAAYCASEAIRRAESIRLSIQKKETVQPDQGCTVV